MSSNSTKHTKANWNISQSRLILYADIMEFKAKLKNTPHVELVKELRQFIDILEKRLSPFKAAGHLRMTLFSDLIVLATDSDDLANFRLISKASAEVMQQCQNFGYPVNGCIARGFLDFDQPFRSAGPTPSSYMPLFVGQPVVDAYLLNEDMFFYGIVLHPNVEEVYHRAMTSPNTDLHLPFMWLEVPLKSGGDAGLYYLNWTSVKLAKNETNLHDLISFLKNLEGKSAVRPRAYIHNTLKILNRINSTLVPVKIH